MKRKKTTYPKWICWECGNKFVIDYPIPTHATYHRGKCGWCKRIETVTEPRDYGYPKFPNA